MASKYSLDLFSVLRMLDKRDMDIYESLRTNPTVLKELETSAGWMLPQWMISAANERDHKELILKFSKKMNTIWLSTSGHPILQLRLLAACGLGKPVRHKFYKRPKSSESSEVMKLLMQIAPDINPDEIDMWVRHNNEEDVIELAGRCGYQEKQMKPLLAEFRRMK